MAALYINASNILDKILKKKGTLKSLVIENGFSNKKKLYALVCETLKYRAIIEEIMEITKIKRHEKQLKKNLALVLIYEYLFGQGLKCGGKFKTIITKNKSSLGAALARMKIKAKVTNNLDLLPKKIITAGSIPRYARVNLLSSSVNEILKKFKDEGYVTQLSSVNMKKGDKSVSVDLHIPDVLVFPPGTDLHDHPLYTTGDIILQDKASCLPAHILNPPPGSFVIDGCAAPGNKTSHLASRMSNKGQIFAFDIDKQRLKVMKKLMQTAGVGCVVMKNMSFLKVDPNADEYKRVEYIVVDPSCSGSGIVSRMDSCTEQPLAEDLKNRLESLSHFQLSALVHALSFPTVKKVVYSTCSIHQKENEDVVLQALKKCHGRFELSHIMEDWTYRGLPVFSGAEKCIRASPELSKTNGFFVALFTRIEKSNTLTKPTDSKEDGSCLSGLKDQQQVVEKSLTLKRTASSTAKRVKKKKNKKKKEKKDNLQLCNGNTMVITYPASVKESISVDVLCNERQTNLNDNNALEITLDKKKQKSKRKGRKKEKFHSNNPVNINTEIIWTLDDINNEQKPVLENCNRLKRRRDDNENKSKKQKRK